MYQVSINYTPDKIQYQYICQKKVEYLLSISLKFYDILLIRDFIFREW